MLKYFMEKVYKKLFFGLRLRVVICVLFGVIEVERRVVEELVYKVGVKEVYIMEEFMVVVIGVGFFVDELFGSMVVDIGGGMLEVVVIFLGGIVISKFFRIVGDEFDEVILNYIKKEYNLMIGDRIVEEIKINIGFVYFFEKEEWYEIKGRDFIIGFLKIIKVLFIEIRDVLKEFVMVIVDVIK